MDNVQLLRQESILREWAVETNENFWSSDVRLRIRATLKEFMEETLEQDLELRMEKMELPEYRNGFYTRNLVSQFGVIENLKVPRLRKGSFTNRVFKRYKRYQDQVETLVQDVFLGGVSTRRVGDILTQILETKVSAAKVSTVCQRLDTKVEAYHKRSLIDEYQYLLLDGITVKVRYNGKYHKRLVLAAYGITLFGKRELIDFKQAKAESKDAWESLLNHLFQRGLKGKYLKLIIMDGSPGLKAACDLVYPQAGIQRCWFHKLQNVSGYCQKKYQESCLHQARKIYKAKDRAHATKEFKIWKQAWIKLCPKAVRCIEKDLEDLLAFLDCPKDHRIRIRTTNVIERTFREARRRIKVFSCFTNLKSSDRILYAIFSHLNRRWKDKPLKPFTQFN